MMSSRFAESLQHELSGPAAARHFQPLIGRQPQGRGQPIDHRFYVDA